MLTTDTKGHQEGNCYDMIDLTNDVSKKPLILDK